MYRITNITPRGKTPISLNSFTVVVGPNNAGKSQLLRDITLCASGRKAEIKVLEDAGIDLGSSAIAFLQDLVARMKPNQVGQYFLDSAGISLDENVSMQYQPNQLSHYTHTEEQAQSHIASAFAREILAYLTTEARLTFTKHRTNLYRPNQRGVSSLVEALFHGSNEDEQWLSDRTLSAFGLGVALDSFSEPSALEIRVANSFAGLLREDRMKAREFMQTCPRLDEQGDGLRSFVATLGAARSLSREVILVDEPEAFLHPPQAFQIGRALVEGDFRGKQIICATHSADFLRGVISAGTNVTVIRVSRSRNEQLVTALRPEELLALARDPVLSSGRVLDGIFYRQVIITESDGDAVLYAALSEDNDRTGETYYVNSYSKQAAATVAAPYKHMGIPHAAIVDIDLIRVGPEFLKVAEAFLKDTSEAERLAANIRSHIEATPAADLVTATLDKLQELPVSLIDQTMSEPEKQLEWLRARLRDIRADASSWSTLKRLGVNSDRLDGQALADLKRLIDVCAAAGLFLVPVGERESWLGPDVPYSKNKTAFTTKALEYLASKKLAPNAPLATFMHDVHAFLEAN